MTRSKRRNGEVVQILKIAALLTGDGPCHYPLPDRSGRPRATLGGVTRSASRSMWMLTYGDPGDLQVLHTCGNGEQGCLRLGHLYLGTHADNMRDKAADGQGHRPSGMTNGQAKLTDDQVREMRVRFSAGGVIQQELADEYGVGRRTVGRILARERWHHLDHVADRVAGGRQ